MKITRERLREIAQEFLKILELEKVKITPDLEKLAGQAIPVQGREQDYLIVTWRPSNSGTRALDASYVIQHRKGEVEGGILLDVKINPELGYSKIIIKSHAEIVGYSPFGRDVFGNIMQEKPLETIDFEEIAGEIRALVV